MNVPDWPWVVGGLFLLLMGLFFGVNLGRVGERARHGDAKDAHDDKPRLTKQPKVDWSSINLDLSSSGPAPELPINSGKDRAHH